MAEVSEAAGYDYQTVKVAFDDGIAWVSLNRPDKRNAMSPTLNVEMLDVLERLEFDDRCDVLVLTGEGEAFSAGMDLKQYFRETDHESAQFKAKVRAAAAAWQWRKLRFYPKPTIAMVNGWCFGGAYGPLYGCDLAVAAEDAQFGLSEINWGILPGGGASKIIVELTGFRNAMYHAMMGENVDGKKAAEWGLVNEAVPADRLKERVTEIATVLLGKNPHALRATKWAIRRVREMTFDNSMDYLVRTQEAANFFDNDGRKEATRQFIDDKTFKPGLGAYDLNKQRG